VSEQKNTQTKSAFFTWTKAIIFVLILALVIFIILYGRNIVDVRSIDSFISLFSGNSSGRSTEANEIFYDDAPSPEFIYIDNHLIYNDGDSVKVFASNGSFVREINVNFSDSVILKNNHYMIIYRLGGKSLFLSSPTDDLHEITYDYPILAACIGDGGYYAVVTENERYSSEVTVYSNTRHRPVYKYYFSNNELLLSLDVSPDNNQLSFLIMNTDSIHFETSLKIFRLDESEIQSSFSFENSIGMAVKFLSNDFVSVVCDNKTFSVDIIGKTINAYDYGGYLLSTYDFCVNVNKSEAQTVLLINKYRYGNNCDMVILDYNGKLVTRKSLNDEIKFISYDKDNYIVLSRKNLDIFDKEGIAKNTLPIENTAVAAFLKDKINILIAERGRAYFCNIG